VARVQEVLPPINLDAWSVDRNTTTASACRGARPRPPCGTARAPLETSTHHSIPIDLPQSRSLAQSIFSPPARP
jgi:hypothetical protein